MRSTVGGMERSDVAWRKNDASSRRKSGAVVKKRSGFARNANVRNAAGSAKRKRSACAAKSARRGRRRNAAAAKRKSEGVVRRR